MITTERVLSVCSDAGIVRDVLVQRPLRRSADTPGAAQEPGADSEEASGQHQRLIGELARLGIHVLQFDELLRQTLAFADARDWILERRLRSIGGNAAFRSLVRTWLDALPGDVLCGHLIEGVVGSELPRSIQAAGIVPGQADDWILRPLSELSNLRGIVRWLHNGVLLGHRFGADRDAAASVSAVLHFAPYFDEAHFGFWLASDGAEPEWPPVDGRDVVMFGPDILVGAVTRNTSGLALKLLSAALRKAGLTDRILCVDLAAAGGDSLDTCLVPLDHDCLLADATVLRRAKAFTIRSGGGDAMQTVEPCGMPLLDAIEAALGPKRLRLIDTSAAMPAAEAHALSALDPVVVAPGRILAFEEHARAFARLTSNGVDVAAAIPGARLSRDGRGPRSLVSAFRTEI